MEEPSRASSIQGYGGAVESHLYSRLYTIHAVALLHVLIGHSYSVGGYKVAQGFTWIKWTDCLEV